MVNGDRKVNEDILWVIWVRGRGIAGLNGDKYARMG